MENECEALPGVAYPGVRDNRSTVNTKTGYDDDDDLKTQWKSHSIGTPTKIRLLNSLVWPVVSYGCESWSL